MWKIFALEMLYGVLLVLCNPKKPLAGLPIGSPAAAGGSGLVVAWKEWKKDKSASGGVVNAVKSKSIRRRWLDDSLQLVRTNISREANRFLEECRHPGFYGEDLTLEPQKGREAFGFLFHIAGRRVSVRPKWGFLHRKMKLEAAQKDAVKPVNLRCGMHGGQQWRTKATEVAVATGNFLRFLDMNNLPDGDVVRGMQRITIELFLADFDLRCIRKALCKVQTSAFFSLKEVGRVLDWERWRMTSWAACYDVEEYARYMEQELCEDMMVGRTV